MEHFRVTSRYVDRSTAREITQVSIVKMGHIYSDDIFLGSYSNLK